MHAGPLGVGEPERQLHPRTDLVLLQELVRDPGGVAAREQLAPRDALVRRVERPGEAVLDAVHDPLGQVADVDELGEPLGRSRRDDLAAAAEPPRPVGEAAGRVVRADDQAGSDDQRALAEDALDLRLGESLQRSVVRGVGRQLVQRQRAELGGRARLGRAGREVGVDGDTRDEDVAARVAELLRRRAHVRRDVAGGVDDGVPAATREQGEVSLAVALQLLDLREELGVRLPAVEERQLVPAGERGLGGRPAEELGAADDQEPQWNL